MIPLGRLVCDSDSGEWHGCAQSMSSNTSLGTMIGRQFKVVSSQVWLSGLALLSSLAGDTKNAFFKEIAPRTIGYSTRSSKVTEVDRPM